MRVDLDLRTYAKKVIARWPLLHDAVLKVHPRSRIFARAYEHNAWGSQESGSGIGSELGATEALRDYLPELFQRLQVRTFLDAPCGDWNWMRRVDLAGVAYTGLDVVPEVIARNRERYGRPGVEFDVADLTRERLPRADLVLCRDCWIHLSFRDAAAILGNFRRSGSTYLLIGNSPHVEQNENQLAGWGWRHLNLQRPPFNFPAGLEARKDHYADQDFQITLWRIADLPAIQA